MFDPEVERLSQINRIPGRTYPEPAYVARVPIALQDTPYKIAGWPMRTVTLTAYQAPSITFKTNQVYPVKKQQRAAMDTTPGAAPTKGIYTGIPSGCNSGNNPYS